MESRSIRKCTPVSGHGWVIPSNTQDPATAIHVLKATQSRELIKAAELKGGFPFTAWRALWNDREILAHKPIYQWSHLIQGKVKGCLMTPHLRKFQLLDESFRHAMLENLSGKDWVKTLFARDFVTSRKLAANQTVKKALDYISENFLQIQSVKKIAIHVGMSPPYFDHLFRKEMKMGCGAYLRKLRMEQAEILVRSGKFSIKEIAIQLGFRRPGDFSRAFRGYFGKSPSSSRNAMTVK